MSSDPGLPVLYYFPTSFYSQKVLLAITEKGLPIVKHDINMGAYEQYEPWYMKINQKGQIPLLEDEGKYISESSEIIKYLDDTYEGILLTPNINRAKWEYYLQKLDDLEITLLTFGAVYHPEITKNACISEQSRERMQMNIDDGTRINALQQLMNNNPELKELYAQKVKEWTILDDQIKNKKRVLEELEKVRTILVEIEEELMKKSDGSWLCGPDFTIADISLAVLLHRLKMVGLSKELWEDEIMMRVGCYYDRLFDRNTFREVCAHGASVTKKLKYAFGKNSWLIFVILAVLVGGLGVLFTLMLSWWFL